MVLLMEVTEHCWPSKMGKEESNEKERKKLSLSLETMILLNFASCVASDPIDVVGICSESKT